MACQTCPHCGHKAVQRTIKTVNLPERAELDRAYSARELTKDAYFTACKAIGFRDDLRFFVRVTQTTLPVDIAVDAIALLSALETRASKSADGKAINALRDRYRATLPSLTIVRVSWLDDSYAVESEAA